MSAAPPPSSPPAATAPAGPAAGPPAPRPSAHLVGQLRTELMACAPFSLMSPQQVDRVVADASLAYFAPGETVLSPADGVVTHLIVLRRGRISGRRGLADAAGGFELEPGDLFPVGAVMGERAVTATYEAREDCFCLLLPVACARALAAESAPFADYMHARVLRFLELSRQVLQQSYASQALAEHSLESPLRTLLRGPPVGVLPQAPLRQALTLMHERRIGSVLVLDDAGALQGILTRHDVLDRVTLPQLPLDTPVAAVMSQPAHALGADATAQDAALLMSRHGIRHVPVTDGGRVVGLVSERDLFAMQRLSIGQLGGAIRAAADLPAMQRVASDLRRFAARLLAQGVGARQLTELVSHLNDLLTSRLVQLEAARLGLDMERACWLAFGSEGRHEQTIATDQDNGIAFDSDQPERDRPRWLALGRAVNAALDACGYPLCRGGVMAGNPACCLSVAEWSQRFEAWIERGAPEDLLAASIYFDFRPLLGRATLLQPMRELAWQRAARVPRFLKQMAENALRHAVPLNWRGGVEALHDGGHEVFDLKMGGTAIFVDVARLYALAHGVEETGTRRRFEAVAPHLHAEPHECEGWIGAFEFLQLQRLRVQIERGDAGGAPAAFPNRIRLDRLNDIDRRVLKESLRIARRLQQRLELDYRR